MRGAIRTLLLLLSAFVSNGCATFVEVDVGEGARFESYRSWSWLPGRSSNVFAPHGSPSKLDSRVSGYIEDALDDRGFVVNEHDPDLLIAYDLAVKPGVESVVVPAATQTITSHHDMSITIDGASTTETREFREVYLAIRIAEPDGRIVWKGSLGQRVAKGRSLPLRSAVQNLLGRLPGEQREALR